MFRESFRPRFGGWLDAPGNHRPVITWLYIIMDRAVVALPAYSSDGRRQHLNADAVLGAHGTVRESDNRDYFVKALQMCPPGHEASLAVGAAL